MSCIRLNNICECIQRFFSIIKIFTYIVCNKWTRLTELIIILTTAFFCIQKVKYSDDFSKKGTDKKKHHFDKKSDHKKKLDSKKYNKHKAKHGKKASFKGDDHWHDFDDHHGWEDGWKPFHDDHHGWDRRGGPHPPAPPLPQTASPLQLPSSSGKPPSQRPSSSGKLLRSSPPPQVNSFAAPLLLR